jgi:hypothetical protein
MFRSIYRARNRGDAEQRLAQFLTGVEQAQLRPFDAFAKGITQWRTELLAYFEEPTTNGYAEGVINKVKVIKRRAYGLPTFAGFRQTRRHNLWLTGQHDATPRNQQEPRFQPPAGGESSTGADRNAGTRQAHHEDRRKDPRFRCHPNLSTPQQRHPPKRVILERLPGPHLT